MQCRLLALDTGASGAVLEAWATHLGEESEIAAMEERSGPAGTQIAEVGELAFELRGAAFPAPAPGPHGRRSDQPPPHHLPSPAKSQTGPGA
jgi:hypothetical protein